ncbi:hypothetical protein P3X46_010280 [Hevea brasiliensis]|uniref:Cytochrome P450 n=1 Tax=Hevea brasiliensis TaxID=3981 RepID=A0ABQ9MG73_HEVBR|nr:hypothetical protein P3X46_010280 [Hevea brasiliensis]
MVSPSLPMWSLSLLLFLPLFFICKRKLQGERQSKQLPPGPPRLPFIGNLHQLGVISDCSLWQLSKQYGPMMHFKLDRVPTVIISSVDAAKELSYNYLDVGFSPSADYWRKMRKICVLEPLSAKRVQSFQFLRDEEVASLVDSISKSASSATPVNLSEKFMSLTAKITCRAAFGRSFQGRQFGLERFQEVICEGMAMLWCFFTADLFPYVGWIVDRLAGLHGRHERIIQELDSFYQRVIDDHIEKGRKETGQEDITDVLLELERSQPESGAGGFQFSRDHIKAILMTPRVMRKAQEEIRTCVGDKRKVSESDIDKLEYLKMVLKETLRLHPLGLLVRETMSKINISGYEIYPKTLIQVNVRAIGRDPKIWKNPEEFFPEMFMDNQFDFNGRSCPGMAMGLALVELALANLLFCFDWKLPYNMKEDINMEEAPGIVTGKKAALLLLPIKYPNA